MTKLKRRATASRGRTGAHNDARNGTAPGLAGNGAAQGIKLDDLRRMKFSTTAIALDLRARGADAARSLIRNRDAITALVALDGLGCRFSVLVANLHEPGAGAFVAAVRDAANLPAVATAAHHRFTEGGATATFWMVITDETTSATVRAALASVAKRQGGVQ